MPWVRLHCVKGYLDMIDALNRFPDLRMNFNFTPVLVKQIDELASQSVKDLWASWSRTDAELLKDEQKLGILEHFFKIHWDNYIHPFPRYRQLLEIRGRVCSRESLEESIHHFSVQDYRDLQTFYNLVWCGFSAQKRYPELIELKRKGSQFTEEEKNRVLDIHDEIVRMILPLYREAQERGQIELTTTPFFHPIMPLVYDTDFARRCMPKASLPPRFSAPEDVLAQLKLAQEQHARIFGKPARGLWPSEGSICPEVLPLLKEAGVEYFCTDEGNLFASLYQDPGYQGKTVDHLELFQAWACEYNGAKVGAVFRERPLSDFIGFNAARNLPGAASEHIAFNLEHIASVAGGNRNASVLVALDGENAWEAFPDGGEQFLSTFYGRLTASSVRTRRLGDYFDEVRDAPVITNLHSGSWINSDFDIWIGDAEENQGWDWIRKTREYLVQNLAEKSWPEETVQKAWWSIYAAEGSDWFWWYGPDFQNDSDLLFDELFRTHLQNVYRILDSDPPSYLQIPICVNVPTDGLIIKPKDFIEPSFDKELASYYDWMGAGQYNIARQHTAMYQADRIGRALYYGFGKENFYFRLDTEHYPLSKIVLYFHMPKTVRVVIDIPTKTSHIDRSDDGIHFNTAQQQIRYIYYPEKRIDVSVPISGLGWEMNGESVAFMVHLYEKTVEKERYPEKGLIEFQAPSSQFRLRNWMV
jgi:alpha-amylase/alpha-mannosidase (GH57 family)